MGIPEQSVPVGQSKPKLFAVIGAGPAGLVTAKILMEQGFEVVIFERGSAVGGTWVYENDCGRQFLYKNLHINTSKRLTAFSDLPFPEDTQRIPDHRDVAKYLAAYADRFGLTKIVRFGTEVRELSPVPVPGSQRPKWKVLVDNQPAEIFDGAVVCTGVFERANHIAQFQSFAGEYLHSSEYREPERHAGKRVCVIGAGNSGVDIASDVSTMAKSVTLVARSGVRITPHFIAGRSLNDITRSLHKWWIPNSVRRFILRWLVYVVHGSEVRLGFKPLTHRVHPSTSSTVVQDIIFGRIKVRHGIDAINGNRVTFTGGETEELDTIIAATGYVTEFPFLSREIIDTTKGNVDLYLRVVPPNWPGLYFVGLINSDTPVNYAAERQARWVAAIESEGAVLPDAAEMQRKIVEKSEWIHRHYGTTARHCVQEESKIYYRQLDVALRKARRRGAKSQLDRTSATIQNNNSELLRLNGDIAAATNDRPKP